MRSIRKKGEARASVKLARGAAKVLCGARALKASVLASDFSGARR